ncbi:MAG: winged helix DNA-binding domain-containing protein, partial [Ktedonobacterales bacterium]|nr:winged helix DNA-binding domain-containing protein [Ktedonobacterales bacterium]
MFIAANARRRAALGLDEERCARGIRAMRALLAAHGPLTRAEFVDQLAARGIDLPGQARAHRIQRAALEGLICFGPDQDAEPTYVLLDDWIDRRRAVSRDVALAELARRYLAAYGPAGLTDFAAWSEMPIRESRIGWERIADDLLAVEAAGTVAWMLKERTRWLEEQLPALPSVVRLLPRYDTYLLGYCQRDFIVVPQFAKRINAGGGILHLTLLV